jgi:hypothetical protein
MSKLLIAIMVGLLALVTVSSSFAATYAAPQPVVYGGGDVVYNGGEGGYLCWDEPFEYSLQATCVEGSDGFTWNAWDGSDYKQPCKTVTVWRYLNSWIFGTRLFTYYQSTNWCYTGSRITWIRRDRWAVITSDGSWMQIDFKGHIGNSCNSENCSEQAGGWTAYISTQGKFQQCAAYYACLTKLPRLQQWINGAGDGHYQTSGT